MSSLYGILALKTAVVHQLPTYILIAFGVILLIAFIIGMFKGVRKVAWGGFYWLLASIGFLFAYKFLGSKNLLAKILKGKLASVADFAWMLALAIGCILVCLIIYGILGMILRPREVLAKEMDEEDEIDDYGFIYEVEKADRKRIDREEIIVVKGGGTPSVFGRIAGGFMCAVNVAAVLAVITALFVLIIAETAFINGALGAIFDVPLSRLVLKYAKAYTLDFLTIGIVMAITYRGYRRGFVGSARGLLATVGVIAVIVLAFVIPFTVLSYEPFVNKFIHRCGDLFTRVKEQYRGIFARATAGAIMAVVGTILVLLINFLLKLATEKIEESSVVRVIDGVLAAILYLIIGVAVVAVFWGALYLLDYCGLFYTSDAFNEYSFLSEEFFEVAEKYLKSFADKYFFKLKAK